MSNLRGDNSIDKQISDKNNEYGNRRRQRRQEIVNKNKEEFINSPYTEAEIESMEQMTLEDFIKVNGITQEDVNKITRKNGQLYSKKTYKDEITDKKLRKFYELCYKNDLKTKKNILNYLNQIRRQHPRKVYLDDGGDEEIPDFSPQNLFPPEENEVPNNVQPVVQENIQKQLASVGRAPQINIPPKEVNINSNNQNLILPKLGMQDVDNRKEQLKQHRYNKALERARDMQPEELQQRYAKHTAQGKVKMQGGNPKLAFAADNAKGAWNLAELDQEKWGRITGTKGNDWINTFNKAHDFSYNPKMLDPQYAAWHGAKYGTTVYQGDVNNDGISDIIEVDEYDKIRTFNGYKIGPSKQKLYQEFYGIEDNKAVGKNGKPYYPVKFDNWYQARSSQLSADERKTLNSDLTKKGMYGYKVKVTSINEHLKNFVKERGIYDAVIQSIAQNLNVNPKLVKGKFLLSSFIGQIVRAFLFKHFNVAPTGNRETDDKIIGKLSRIANSKKTGLKDNIINLLKGIFTSQTIVNAAKQIWDNLILNEDYLACQQWLVTNIAFNQQLATTCQEALNAANTSSRERAQAIAADRHYKENPMAELNNINWR